MSTSISGLSGAVSSGYPQSIIRALQNAGIIGGAGSAESGAGGIGVSIGSSIGGPADASQLSPLAQILSPLQQLQQSNVAQYGQITEEIAANLAGAAQSAQAAGNSPAANELNQLAANFTDASETGQLPDISGLAQAVSGGTGYGDSGTVSSLSSFNPLTIIQNTLENAGVAASNR